MVRSVDYYRGRGSPDERFHSNRYAHRIRPAVMERPLLRPIRRATVEVDEAYRDTTVKDLEPKQDTVEERLLVPSAGTVVVGEGMVVVSPDFTDPRRELFASQTRKTCQCLCEFFK